MVFTRHSAGKIWSLIFIQDIVLHYQINPLQPDVAFLYPLKISENLKVSDLPGR